MAVNAADGGSSQIQDEVLANDLAAEVASLIGVDHYANPGYGYSTPMAWGA